MKKLIRETKNALMFEEVEIVVREATANEPFEATSQQKRSALRFMMDPHRQDYDLGLSMVWKRLNDQEVPNHVRRALELIQFFLAEGPEHLKNDIVHRKQIFRVIKRKQYFVESVEVGQAIRELAEAVTKSIEQIENGGSNGEESPANKKSSKKSSSKRSGGNKPKRTQSREPEADEDVQKEENEEDASPPPRNTRRQPQQKPKPAKDEEDSGEPGSNEEAPAPRAKSTEGKARKNKTAGGAPVRGRQNAPEEEGGKEDDFNFQFEGDEDFFDNPEKKGQNKPQKATSGSNNDRAGTKKDRSPPRRQQQEEPADEEEPKPRAKPQPQQKAKAAPKQSEENWDPLDDILAAPASNQGNRSSAPASGHKKRDSVDDILAGAGDAGADDSIDMFGDAKKVPSGKGTAGQARNTAGPDSDALFDSAPSRPVNAQRNLKGESVRNNNPNRGSAVAAPASSGKDQGNPFDSMWD